MTDMPDPDSQEAPVPNTPPIADDIVRAAQDAAVKTPGTIARYTDHFGYFEMSGHPETVVRAAAAAVLRALVIYGDTWDAEQLAAMVNEIEQGGRDEWK